MMNKKTLIAILSILFGTFYGAAAFAQDDAAPAEEDPVAKELKALQEKIDAQDKKIEAQSKKIESQDAALNEVSEAQAKQEEKNATVDEELETAAMDRDDLAMQVMDAAAAAAEQKFTVSGFMDLSWTGIIPDKEDNFSFTMLSRYNSFYQTGVNLYFKSQMTDTLSALVETRFSYSPLGRMDSIPSVVVVDGNEVARDGEFQRTDTYASYQYEGGTYLGGVNIERAHLDWKPRDWFGFRAGRYLTPFGIWNEDHGAPVVLTAALPYLISFEVAPVAQTGLMLFGSGFPTDFLSLEYAVTLSNGRGPTESFVDTDDNKAIGLRTKAIFSGDDWRVQLGSYGYYGKYTDIQTEQHTIINGTEFELLAKDVILQKYKEYLGTLDLKMQWRGLSLFGEAGLLKVEQIVPLESVGFDGSTNYEPNYLSKTAYAMLSYQLPLENVFDTLTITPFVGIDTLTLTDAIEDNNFVVYRFGINWKPSPFVTIKTNALQVNLENPNLPSELWFIKGQIAVSF